MDFDTAGHLERSSSRKTRLLRRRLRAATRGGSRRGRLRGTGGSGFSVAADPTVVVPEVAGSGGGVVPQTTPSLAREERPSYREIWGLSDPSHYSLDQMEGRERVRVEIVPGVTEGVLEDGLGIQDQGVVWRQLGIGVCCEQVKNGGTPRAQ